MSIHLNSSMILLYVIFLQDKDTAFLSSCNIPVSAVRNRKMLNFVVSGGVSR